MENYVFILKTIEIPLLKISERKPEKILQKSKMGNAIFLARAIFSVQDYYLNHKDPKEKLKGSIDRKFHSDVFEKCI